MNRVKDEMKEENSAQTTERRPLLKRLPRYAVICYLYFWAIDFLVFYGTRPILPYLPSHSLSTPLDEMIPVRSAWIVVYVAAFATWFITIAWIMPESKRHAYRLCGAYTIIMIASLICFLAYPVTIQRPEITEGGVFNDLLRLIYSLDSPTDLCPSLHVVLNYVCWRCTLDCRKIPKWYQWFNLVCLILVCFSILFVKQHFIADIFVALVITEGALQIGRLTRIERIGFAIEERFKRRKDGSA